MTGQFQNISYRRSEDDPATFYFIPGDPEPELSPSGAPAANMILSGSSGILQLGVHWSVSQEEMKALQDYLQREFPQLNSPPQLRMEPVAVEAVKLALTMPDGSSTMLATTGSSGYLPFAAVFNVVLDGSRYSQTRLAMAGQQKVLKVSYEIAGQSHLLCTATVSGDARQDLAELDPAADITACRAQMESALNDGRMELAISGDDVSESLRAKTIDMAKDQAASVLRRMLGRSETELDAAHLSATATLSEEHPLRLVREADVGAWFTGGKVASFLVSPPAKAATSGGRANKTIRTSFDVKDMPIAFIRASSAISEATLVGPSFDQVTLAMEAGQAVEVKTNYTDGGPAYETQVEVKGDVVGLTPHQLGLCPVTFDGTARKQSGVQGLKIRAKYVPEGNGSEDERTISWRFGDWSETWYLVSRDSGLAGVIEYSWQETASDGTVIEHPALKTKETELKL
jgi:hypothetical protein